MGGLGSEKGLLPLGPKLMELLVGGEIEGP